MQLLQLIKWDQMSLANAMGPAAVQLLAAGLDGYAEQAKRVEDLFGKIWPPPNVWFDFFYVARSLPDEGNLPSFCVFCFPFNSWTISFHVKNTVSEERFFSLTSSAVVVALILFLVEEEKLTLKTYI